MPGKSLRVRRLSELRDDLEPPVGEAPEAASPSLDTARLEEDLQGMRQLLTRGLWDSVLANVMPRGESKHPARAASGAKLLQQAQNRPGCARGYPLKAPNLDDRMEVSLVSLGTGMMRYVWVMKQRREQFAASGQYDRAVAAGLAGEVLVPGILPSPRRPTVARGGLGLEVALEGYEQLLETQGLATDVATAATLNAASDTVAQLSEVKDRKPFSAARVLRYMSFGSLDGFAGHHWFEALDMLPKHDSVLDTAQKVLADSLVYTPCWCACFLFVMAVLEGRAAEAISEVRKDFWELLTGNYGLTLPFVALIYGCSPVRYQVACFALLTLAYTIVLSLWANARPQGAARGSPS
ncbi:unnamed protein product [Effrenium voratum]|nr:unnamed protein product [Effrenium voratum]